MAHSLHLLAVCSVAAGVSNSSLFPHYSPLKSRGSGFIFPSTAGLAGAYETLPSPHSPQPSTPDYTYRTFTLTYIYTHVSYRNLSSIPESNLIPIIKCFRLPGFPISFYGREEKREEYRRSRRGGKQRNLSHRFHPPSTNSSS